MSILGKNAFNLALKQHTLIAGVTKAAVGGWNHTTQTNNVNPVIPSNLLLSYAPNLQEKPLTDTQSSQKQTSYYFARLNLPEKSAIKTAQPIQLKDLNLVKKYQQAEKLIQENQPVVDPKSIQSTISTALNPLEQSPEVVMQEPALAPNVSNLVEAKPVQITAQQPEEYQPSEDFIAELLNRNNSIAPLTDKPIDLPTPKPVILQDDFSSVAGLLNPKTPILPDNDKFDLPTPKPVILKEDFSSVAGLLNPKTPILPDNDKFDLPTPKTVILQDDFSSVAGLLNPKTPILPDNDKDDFSSVAALFKTAAVAQETMNNILPLLEQASLMNLPDPDILDDQLAKTVEQAIQNRDDVVDEFGGEEFGILFAQEEQPVAQLEQAIQSRPIIHNFFNFKNFEVKNYSETDLSVYLESARQVNQFVKNCLIIIASAVKAVTVATGMLLINGVCKAGELSNTVMEKAIDLAAFAIIQAGKALRPFAKPIMPMIEAAGKLSIKLGEFSEKLGIKTVEFIEKGAEKIIEGAKKTVQLINWIYSNPVKSILIGLALNITLNYIASITSIPFTAGAVFAVYLAFKTGLFHKFINGVCKIEELSNTVIEKAIDLAAFPIVQAGKALRPFIKPIMPMIEAAGELSIKLGEFSEKTPNTPVVQEKNSNPLNLFTLANKRKIKNTKKLSEESTIVPNFSTNLYANNELD